MLASHVCGIAKRTLVHHADVGSELSGELITKSQARLSGTQTRTYSAQWIVLAIRRDLHQRL